jgi:hypothetical protein
MMKPRLYKWSEFEFKTDIHAGETFYSNTSIVEKFALFPNHSTAYLMPPNSVLVFPFTEDSPLNSVEISVPNSVMVTMLLFTPSASAANATVTGSSVLISGDSSLYTYNEKKKAEPQCDCGGKFVGSHVYWCTLVEKGIWRP